MLFAQVTTVGTVNSTGIDSHCFPSTMKDSSPTLASILIFGIFSSVLSAQDDLNRQWTTGNPGYLKFYAPPSFRYTTIVNNEETSPILNDSFTEFKDARHNSDVEGHETNRGGGYQTNSKNRSYGFYTRFILLVSHSKHPNFHRSDTNYSNKSPIQILPSRFPPPLEKLIQNIQNYFSTYNHPDLQNRPSLQQSPQPATSTEQEVQTSHPTEPTTEINEEIITENTEENTVVTLAGN